MKKGEEVKEESTFMFSCFITSEEILEVQNLWTSENGEELKKGPDKTGLLYTGCYWVNATNSREK